jgi:RNA polymerase sigma factor (TIGR02999 family)
MTSPSQITQLLRAWSDGDQSAFDRLVPLIYKRLHDMAARQMRQQPPDHTLQATALLNEAYLRMAASGPDKTWGCREHFFAVAAKAMRHILVDGARQRGSEKRGGGVSHVPFDEPLRISMERPRDILALDDALILLEKLDPRQSKVVELRFFGGLTVAETAQVLRVSQDTVARDWKAAKAWLYRQLSHQTLK